MIPAASDFKLDYETEYFQGSVFGESAYLPEEVEKIMIEFARLHVEAALNKVADEAKIINNWQHGMSIYEGIDKDSILNAYPLENIK